MKLIEVTKKTQHKTDQIQLAISILCLVNNFKLSRTEIIILSYYVVYGYKDSTHDMLFKGKVVKNKRSLSNCKSRLCRKGFLKKDPSFYGRYELNLSKGFDPNAPVINLLIKLDNK